MFFDLFLKLSCGNICLSLKDLVLFSVIFSLDLFKWLISSTLGLDFKSPRKKLIALIVNFFGFRFGVIHLLSVLFLVICAILVILILDLLKFELFSGNDFVERHLQALAVALGCV